MRKKYGKDEKGKIYLQESFQRTESVFLSINSCSYGHLGVYYFCYIELVKKFWPGQIVARFMCSYRSCDGRILSVKSHLSGDFIKYLLFRRCINDKTKRIQSSKLFLRLVAGTLFFRQINSSFGLLSVYFFLKNTKIASFETFQM